MYETSDKEKAESYYRALCAVLKKLQAHTATEESSGRLKAYLIGYILGTIQEVPKEESK